MMKFGFGSYFLKCDYYIEDKKPQYEITIHKFQEMKKKFRILCLKYVNLEN